nr:NADH dehydrogenase subunit 2 [Gilpinia sp. 3 GYN-2022c]
MTSLNFINNFMKLMNLNKYFYLMLIFGTLITINSTSWIGSWMGMEINLMAFIPLLMNSMKLSKNSNSSMLYYIIQVGSSSMLLLMMMMMKMSFILMNINLFMMFMQISLILKLGASPFHWWMIKIIKNMNWVNCFLLMTFQKIAPLFLLFNTNMSMIIYLSMMFSGFVGSFMGINQISLKLLMGYSSLNHLSWMFMTMMIDMNIMLIYLMIYFFNNFIICMFFMLMKINYLNQIYNYNNMNFFMKFLIMMMFLSMAGIPPMFGFLPKFFVFILMIKNMFFFESLIFIMFALIVLFYYVNLIMPSMLNLKLSMKLNLNYLGFNFYFILVILINFFIMFMIYFMLIFYFNN